MVVGAVLLAVGLPYSMQQEPTDPVPASELARMEALDAAADAEDAAAAARRKEIAGTRVAFLGDSFSAGVGANPGEGYVDLIAAATRWTPDVFAQGGTGYTNPGQAEQSEAIYADRVPDVVAATPGLVIVQGSTNDHDAEEAEEAAAETLGALRQALPDARIIVLGPTDTPVGATTPDVRDAIARAAATYDLPFVDAWDWLAPDDARLWIEDGAHPSPTGHEVLADRLVHALLEQGVLVA